MGELPGKRTDKGIRGHPGPRVVVQSQVPPLCPTQQPRSHAYALRSRCLQKRWPECAHEKLRSPETSLVPRAAQHLLPKWSADLLIHVPRAGVHPLLTAMQSLERGGKETRPS